MNTSGFLPISAASGPDHFWVVNITLVPKAAGFLYLEVVLDAGSRKPDAERQSEIVGWSMAHHLRTELVLDAMEAALGQRRPSSVIHHSDQGCQLGFNRSSQQQAEPSAAPGQTSRRAFAIQASSVAWH